MISIPSHPGDHVILQITPWLARQKDLPSLHLEGEVKVVTPKALLLSGYPSIGRSSHCRRCGREITNPLSLWCGYGPICSDLLGIPRDATEDQLEEVRKLVATTTPIEEWFPLSQITSLEERKNNDPLQDHPDSPLSDYL